MSPLSYGAFGAPLAFMALPLAVHLPAFYGGQLGVSLGALGLLLMALRAVDALLDPVLGRWADGALSRGQGPVLRLMALACSLMAVGFVGLFVPPAWSVDALLVWCGVCLTLGYAGYSLGAITHQAWGARLGGGPVRQAERAAWREGAALAGVLVASVLPTWLGWQGSTAVFVVVLAVGAWALRAVPVPVSPAARPVAVGSVLSQQAGIGLPWRQPGFAVLIGSFMASGVASAIPATLVLFFVRDRIGAAAYEGGLLALYFTAAALSLPLWLRAVARWGLARSWALGMALSMLAFVGAALLGRGDVLPFALVCAASGLALGADLMVPGALLAQWLERRRLDGTAAGLCFGWWNAATKFNLALAAGLALPLLALAGYRPGAQDSAALQALTLAYCALPCALKGLALMLWGWAGCRGAYADVECARTAANGES